MGKRYELTIADGPATSLDDKALAAWCEENMVGMSTMDRMFEMGVGEKVRREGGHFGWWQVERREDRAISYAECVLAVKEIAPPDRYWTLEIETTCFNGTLETLWRFYISLDAGRGEFVDAKNADELVRRVQSYLCHGGTRTDLASVDPT